LPGGGPPLRGIPSAGGRNGGRPRGAHRVTWDLEAQYPGLVTSNFTALHFDFARRLESLRIFCYNLNCAS
ncbi:MAG: hypothetical protein IJP66_00635, partial [Kiritimatiellae bacterium]|nr:hypothetical protein [Kiritimatiellia bacterium]